MLSAKIIADSINSNGDRLTTMECTFHRFILPEFNTYRMWSRNAASSRAIPLKRKIKEVRENPAIPVSWGRNKPGMVADEELDHEQQVRSLSTWIRAAATAADHAEVLGELNLHKQLANRILEPFSWHTSVVTATEWDNMFTQRIHKDAQPEFHALAVLMKAELENSEPQLLNFNQWHLPYVTGAEQVLNLDTKKKIAVARVARSSYLNQDKTDIDADLALYDRLRNAEPPHLSPFEMVARPALPNEEVFGNFSGWIQLRHGISSS
jgi:hypothetical protein